MNYTQDEQKALAFAKLLREKAQWPAGFQWAYNDCAMCAMGLFCAATLGDATLAKKLDDRELAQKMFGAALTFHDWEDICYYADLTLADQDIYVGGSENVQPEDVAMLIERAIARKHEKAA